MSKNDFLSNEREMYIKVLRKVLWVLDRNIGTDEHVDTLDLENGKSKEPYITLVGIDRDGDEILLNMSMLIESKFDVLLTFTDDIDGRKNVSKTKLEKRGLTIRMIANEFESFFHYVVEG